MIQRTYDLTVTVCIVCDRRTVSARSAKRITVCSTVRSDGCGEIRCVRDA
jgi:hypothetical protein